MKILIDARFTRLDHHDGISRYGASLIAATARIADVSMLISDVRQLPMLPDVPYTLINSPLSPAELFVAGKVNKLGADVVVCPMQTMGSWGRKYALVLTLHDLIYYEHPAPPGFLPAPVRVLWRLYHKAFWPQRLLLNRADVVATISSTTAALISKYRLTRRPVRIVGNAPQHGHTPRDPGAGADKTLLYMGSFMPYKNVETMIRGMAELPDMSLHLLSRITPERRAELEALAPAGADIVFHNGVTDAEYEAMLGRTTALISLSKAEGYGLPLVEAVSHGTPVIASDIPIFREVGGDAVSYVHPDSPAEFAAAVRKLEEPDLWKARSRRSVECAPPTSARTVRPQAAGRRRRGLGAAAAKTPLGVAAASTSAFRWFRANSTRADIWCAGIHRNGAGLEHVHAVEPELHGIVGAFGGRGDLDRPSSTLVTCGAWPCGMNSSVRTSWASRRLSPGSAPPGDAGDHEWCRARGPQHDSLCAQLLLDGLVSARRRSFRR